MCKKSGFERSFKFLKSIPHAEVMKYQLKSDIYVSANTDGNLINTNLEAIACDSCMIIPENQSEKFIDIETHKLLGKSVVYFKVKHVDDLKNKILYLLNNPKKILEFKKKISITKKKFIRTWKERVQEEEKILYNLLKTESK